MCQNHIVFMFDNRQDRTINNLTMGSVNSVTDMGYRCVHFCQLILDVYGIFF